MIMTLSVVLRTIDVLLAILGVLILFPVFLLLYVLGLIDTGSPILYQERIGRNRRSFVLMKFRTMKLGTAHVATHMVSRNAITPLGALLRRTKLDELPQVWNVLRGEMSFVGPRPGLPNQFELIQARVACGVYSVRPGITGLAQINTIDMSTPELLAETDAQMLRELSLVNYFKYLIITVAGKGAGDRVKIG